MGPGRGSIDLGLGIDSRLGALGRLELLHRFDDQWAAGLLGEATYGLAGPRRNRLDGSILAILRGRW